MVKFSALKNLALLLFFMISIANNSYGQDNETSKNYSGIRGNLSHSMLRPNLKFDFDAYFGRHLNDKTSFGLSLGYSRTVTGRSFEQQTNFQYSIFKLRAYKIGLFGRKELLKGNRLSLILEANLDTEIMRLYGSFGIPVKGESFSLGFKPVFTYNLSKRFKITGHLGGFQGKYEQFHFDKTGVPNPEIGELNIGFYNEVKLGLEFDF